MDTKREVEQMSETNNVSIAIKLMTHSQQRSKLLIWPLKLIKIIVKQMTLLSEFATRLLTMEAEMQELKSLLLNYVVFLTITLRIG